jgi:MATE family multidrug resistance protein
LSEYLLLFLGQDAQLCALTAQYTRLLLIGIPPYFVSYIFTIYLQSQHIMNPLVIIGLITNLCNALFNYLLIYYFGFGFSGGPIAISLTRWLHMILTLLYLYFSKEHKRTWPKFSLAPLQRSRIVPFLKLGLPGCVSVALEVWCFEIATILSGVIGQLALDTQAVLINIVYLSFMTVPYPFSNGAQIQLGNKLGANDPEGARLTARLSLTMVALFMLVNMVRVGDSF